MPGTPKEETALETMEEKCVPISIGFSSFEVGLHFQRVLPHQSLITLIFCHLQKKNLRQKRWAGAVCCQTHGRSLQYMTRGVFGVGGKWEGRCIYGMIMPKTC